MNSTRRSFFKLLAGAAALPVVAKLPLPAQRIVERAGAWATIRVKDGMITAVTITNGGAGYVAGDSFTLAGFGPVQVYKNNIVRKWIEDGSITRESK